MRWRPAKAATRAGVTSHEVDAAGRSAMREAGFADGFEHRLGYSIGIGFPPDWGEGRIMSINENDPLVLESGMCFHYIPGHQTPAPGRRRIQRVPDGDRDRLRITQ